MKKFLATASLILLLASSAAYYRQIYLPQNQTNTHTAQEAQGSTPSLAHSPVSSTLATPNHTIAPLPSSGEPKHQCAGCSSFPARHPSEDRELTPVEKYSMVHNHFPPDITVDTLPAGHFKVQLQALPEPIQQKVLQQLVVDKTPTINLNSLHISDEGVLLFACRAPDPQESPAIASAESTELHPQAALSAVPVSAPPALSSRLGSSNTLYIDFNGHIVTGTAWGAVTWDCLPFDTDGDSTTFSPAEQSAIIRIWEQVAEDYAHFNVNVTTVEPATFTNRTARALVTRNTDRNGVNLPYNTAGGVAYINVFGSSLYSRYSPAFIYHNRLSNVSSHIADAITHEVGHNLGLYHDGIIAQGDFPASEYYDGHGSGDLSWGPIMGSPYWKNFTQWSKGEYFRGNNAENDLSKIGFKLGYRPDYEGSTLLQAEEFTGTLSGVIDDSTDKDIWWVETFSSIAIELSTVDLGSGGGRGGNLLSTITIFNEAGIPVESVSQTSQSSIAHTVSVSPGKYFIQVSNQSTGSPLNATPTGFTAYGSLGQYNLSIVINEYVAGPLDHFLEWGQDNLVSNVTDPYYRTTAEPLTNFERYAYNITQDSPSPETRLPKTSIFGQKATVSFRVGQPDHVTYRVLESRDLSNWTEVDMSTNTVESIQETGATRVTVQSTQAGLPVFFKLVISPIQN